MKKELLLKVSAGDETAFTQLFKLYQGRVYTVARAVTRSAQMAEELVQEVFMNVWMHRGKLAGLTDFESYLFIITRNEAYQALKKMARRQNFLKKVEEAMRQSISVSNAEEQLAAGRDYELVLNTALAHLSPQQQSVFQLIQGQGLSRKEVALRLQISPESVKTHFSRALKNIRSLFPNYQAGSISYPQR